MSFFLSRGNEETMMGSKWSRLCVYGNAAVFAGLAIYFFVLPALMIGEAVLDPGMKGEGIPKLAWRVHKSLSPRFEKWAKERNDSGRASELNNENISGTEWPMFGTVFYLWATEALQQAWEKDKSMSKEAPAVYARGAIEQGARLVMDKNNAAWVRNHWGEDYLKKENAFFRMLLINGLTSHYNLLKDERYTGVLREQVESLAKEIDESPHGWLDDYPNQCYPTDVEASIAAIKRADGVLGTDHNDFVKRCLRGFSGKALDRTTGLPSYEGDARFGIVGVARGCANAWALISGPYLWPEEARKWYKASEERFYQANRLAAGFREFKRGDKEHGPWHIDVDSGPVMAGLGAAATAFGAGAARINGRFDHAYTIGVELAALSAQLPDGSLLLPRLLSDKSDAPCLGESSILMILTRSPAPGFGVVKGGYVTGLVYIVIALYALIGVIMLLGSFVLIRRAEKVDHVRSDRIQAAAWAAIIVTGCVLIAAGQMGWGVLALLMAQFLPRVPMQKKDHNAAVPVAVNEG